MISLQFVKTWLKYLAVTVLALVIERGAITHPGWLLAAAIATVLAFLGVTLLLFREWRAEQNGAGAYHYQLIEYVNHD
ncbi:hypothetical protein [Qaidamihabitans albus]|uniref:hypothetical protein n=1 Tax=Qaidamihabitans albus TaxID=2795733 RepID=UPI0018F1F072|nr:hypothetical protein [Qaidamihabitans albus]